MDVAGALELLGGVASRRELIALTSRADLETALRAGAIVRVARGRYAALSVDGARRAAHRISGITCLLSAALEHGWAVKATPELPQVCVPRNRNLTKAQCAGIDVRRADLHADDMRNGVTSRDRTLLDCGRHLPPDAGLAVFDSALRDGFPPTRLASIARDAHGPGARRIRLLAGRADGDAANPFESVLRSIAHDVPGLQVRPQVPIWDDEFLGRPDLVDDDLRVILEADSFAWHGGRVELGRDARRYNRFVVHGWLVLRFCWEDVMFDPDYVRAILVAAVNERTYRLCPRCRCA